ncbi:MAG TPA: V-type ATPase subunit subunit G family protein [Methanoregula sp.]|jgi:vacuolar-type H+-ATPase subunit H|nr:V-type ATPase subunit subunit G family protein [Methanoregula sp.]
MDDEEKTLLQQIREKEQEYAKKTEMIKKETEAAIASAQAEAESLLCTADSAGKTEAERFFWEEKGKIEAEIEGLRRGAAAERDMAAARGEKNLSRAVETIAGYVTME